VLDTRIYNGHTSTSDALWAGVPVLTLKGSHFASRVSASILTAMGLPELITEDMIRFEDLAVQLAKDPERLKALRERIAVNRRTAPLFDTARFARNLERAYRIMWDLYRAGEAPRPITIGEP
jgi:predicted O-linked N-acetylglucosamine transferase (SPINDLY family)